MGSFHRLLWILFIVSSITAISAMKKKKNKMNSVDEKNMQNIIKHANVMEQISGNDAQIVKKITRTRTITKTTRMRKMHRTRNKWFKDPSTKLRPFQRLCDSAVIIDDIGYVRHPVDCDGFIQCFYNENGMAVKAVYRQCEFGKFWKDDIAACMESTTVFCPTEKCVFAKMLSYPLSVQGNCRMYWQCNLKASIGFCCPKGFRYKIYSGCVKDDGCQDKCPLTFGHNEGKCNRRPNFLRLSGYLEYVPGYGWFDLDCPRGSRYSAVMCKCISAGDYTTGMDVCKPEIHLPFNGSFDDVSGNGYKVKNHRVRLTPGGYAFFNGGSYLQILDFGKMPFEVIAIEIRFLALDRRTRLSGILSNGFFKNGTKAAPTFFITKSQQNIHYLAKPMNTERGKVFNTPFRKFNWNTATLFHDTYTAEVATNELSNADWNYGGLKQSDLPLTIGKAPGFSGLRGYVDYVTVYRCRPLSL